jgi:hypothetical protein
MEILMEIFENLPYIISFAAAVSAVTKTPKDDEAVSKFKKAYGTAYKVVDVLALNFGHAKNR